MAGGLRVVIRFFDGRMIFIALLFTLCLCAPPIDGDAMRRPSSHGKLEHHSAVSDTHGAADSEADGGRRDVASDSKSGSHHLKLADDTACAADVRRLCGKNVGQNNFAVIDCLQSDVTKDEEISDACQHLVWNYKLNLTTDFRFDSAAEEICGTTLQQDRECSELPKGKGMVIPCLIEHFANISNDNCKAFLRRMESIVFSDYRLVYKFADKCRSDIDRTGCGRISASDDNSLMHNQGKSLTCLAEHLDTLDGPCKQELLRVAELQADDYHNDRQLYYACREDRETLCHKVKAGEGRVYKCLFRHKFDQQMSNQCLKQLTLRQQLQQEDYKVNLKLARSCQSDIVSNRCLRQIEEVAGFKNARLSAILLCLEGAMKDGKVVAPECVVELKEVRRSLMEDYQISPVLVRDCSNEIQTHCGGGLHREGKTIHCLMDLARPKKKKVPTATLR